MYSLYYLLKSDILIICNKKMRDRNGNKKGDICSSFKSLFGIGSSGKITKKIDYILVDKDNFLHSLIFAEKTKKICVEKVLIVFYK